MVTGMNAVSLPARIIYTVIALPLGAEVGFRSCMRLLPEFAVDHPGIAPGMDDSGAFKVAICVGVAIAFSAALWTLTLPWIRHRKRTGRPWRIGLSGAVVVVASVVFADQGFKLIYDLLFAAWLTYMLTFTFVRYGVIDEARRRRSSSAAQY